MLDSKDLELLRAMMQEVVSESEARMTAMFETRLTEKIGESEARMTAMFETRLTEKITESEARITANFETRLTEKIAESEARMTAKIEESAADTRSTLMAYIESAIEPKFRMLAEGHKTLQETLAPKSRVEKLEEEESTSRSLIMALGVRVSNLENSQ